MTTYSKTYIGKGKKVNNLDIVRVTVNMDEAEAHIREYEGKRYLTFELAALKETDQYGRTHTAYINQKETAEQPEEPAKPRRGKKVKAA